MVSAWVSHRCLWLVGSSEAAHPLVFALGTSNRWCKGEGISLSLDFVLRVYYFKHVIT